MQLFTSLKKGEKEAKMAPKISFSGVIGWIWAKSLNCLIKTFASACVVLGAAMPYLFWVGFGAWPYYAFLAVVQGVFILMGIGLITGIVRTGGLVE
jgi:hypothetical protein